MAPEARAGGLGESCTELGGRRESEGAAVTGLLGTSSGAGQESRVLLRGSRARSSAPGAVGAGFRPLCLRSLRPGHYRSRGAGTPRPAPRSSTGRRCPRALSSPLLGVSLSRAIPQSTRLSARGPARAARGRPQARLASLLVQLPNRKSVRVTRTPRAHARSQPPRLRLPRSPGWSRRAGGPRGRRTSGTRRSVLSPLPGRSSRRNSPGDWLRRNRRAQGPACV